MRQISFRLLIAILTLTIGVTASVVLAWSVRQNYIQNVLEAVERIDDSIDVPFSVEPQICAVHNAQMHHDRVPISYGLPYIPLRYPENRERFFPNSNQSIMGGCQIGRETHAEVYYCSSCREAETTWRRNNDPVNF